MTRWFTSDTHFGHKNIIEYCGRPFSSVDEMNDALVDRINALIPEGDELWILGDIALGSLSESLPVLQSINARIVLVGGNHDRFHPFSKKNGPWVERYLALTGAAELRVTNARIAVGDHDVQLSHFPYQWDTHDLVTGRGADASEDLFGRWRPVDDGGWLLNGHVHEKWRQRGRQINVGIDAWGGRPVSEHTVAELIAEGPADRDRLTWSC